MAGDWIKVSTGLPRHPKVVRMASALKADRFRIVGGRVSAWCLFDEYPADGVLRGYTPETLDDLTGFPGLAQAMLAVGWLQQPEPETLVMPEFETHNGQSAKRRALDAERKRGVRKVSALYADKMRTRVEESRGEKEQKQAPAPDSADPCPHEDIIAAYHEILPASPRVKVWTDKRRAHLRTRWREDPKRQSIDYWRRFFEHVATSPFLTGRSATAGRDPFLAGLDWLVTSENFAKVIEGRYHPRAEV